MYQQMTRFPYPTFDKIICPKCECVFDEEDTVELEGELVCEPCYEEAMENREEENNDV